MKLRCTRIVSPTTGESLTTSPWLTVGREYEVLEISALVGREIHFRIQTDRTGSPGLWDSRLFETVEADIPADWIASIDDAGNLTLGPAAWQRLGFWEDYFDGDPEAVRTYEQVVRPPAS